MEMRLSMDLERTNIMITSTRRDWVKTKKEILDVSP